MKLFLLAHIGIDSLGCIACATFEMLCWELPFGAPEITGRPMFEQQACKEALLVGFFTLLC